MIASIQEIGVASLCYKSHGDFLFVVVVEMAHYGVCGLVTASCANSGTGDRFNGDREAGEFVCLVLDAA